MNPETVGQLSGLIVMLSGIPYMIRIYQRKIQPNLVSFSIWSLVGLALLLTYRDSGAGSNLWPAVFGFINPTLITILALWRGEKRKPEKWEIVCGMVGIASLVWWWFVRNEASQVQSALYLAIIADAGAAIPTIGFLWKHPEKDRPLMWSMFGIGYGLAVFAITDHTFANYALPVYMFIGANLIAGILFTHRIRNRIPIREWV